jgi:hypothetical protein
LTNQEGNLPAGINVRGVGGYTICPYAVLPAPGVRAIGVAK